MIHFLFLLFLLIGISACNHADLHSTLFYNSALEDSLEQYISYVPEIKNPYGAPPIMDIWINIEKKCDGVKDTLVFISATYRIGGPPGYQDSWDSPFISYYCETRGAAWVAGRMCIIRYINHNSFSDLVNESVLTIPPKEFDFFLTYDGPTYDVAISRSSRLYRISGKDSVILLEKDVGDFETKIP